MQQLELLSIDNPCIGVCQSDNRGYCRGCFRSRDERFEWATMTPPQKRKVLELCKGRGKRRKAKEKKQATEQAQAAALEQPKQDKNTIEDTSCVGKCDQTVQDMGLDLFDL